MFHSVAMRKNGGIACKAFRENVTHTNCCYPGSTSIFGMGNTRRCAETGKPNNSNSNNRDNKLTIYSVSFRDPARVPHPHSTQSCSSLNAGIFLFPSKAVAWGWKIGGLLSLWGENLKLLIERLRPPELDCLREKSSQHWRRWEQPTWGRWGTRKELKGHLFPVPINASTFLIKKDKLLWKRRSL